MNFPKMTFWTEEKEHQLRELWAQSKTYREIAAALGTTHNAIAGRCHRMNLHRPGYGVKVHKPKPLLKLQENDCRWPVEDRLFCAKPKEKRSSYCTEHAKIARWGRTA